MSEIWYTMKFSFDAIGHENKCFGPFKIAIFLVVQQYFF